MPLDPPLLLTEEPEEDSVFVSLADLFSLLSLTIIYVVLTFGQTVPADTTEAVVAAALQGTGPGKPINPEDCYVSLESQGTNIVFRFVKGEFESRREVPIGSASPIPEEWLITSLAAQTGGTIFLYLPANENSVVVKALFTDTARLLKDHFRNVRVAL